MQWINEATKRLPIVELYPAVQGEGRLLGTPILIIRTTGCTHRCYFGERGGWCDTWYTSIHAEKGRYCWQDIINCVAKYPQIRALMITGGAPTMHPQLLNEISCFATTHNLHVTLETEGSHAPDIDYPFDLVSISPKFSNSIPRQGVKTPLGKIVNQALIDTHNRYRLRQDIMRQLIMTHRDYQFKVVWDGEDQQTLVELRALQEALEVPDDKVYLMPAGGTREALLVTYPRVMDACVNLGYCFTPRPKLTILNFTPLPSQSKHLSHATKSRRQHLSDFIKSTRSITVIICKDSLTAAEFCALRTQIKWGKPS